MYVCWCADDEDMYDLGGKRKGSPQQPAEEDDFYTAAKVGDRWCCVCVR